MKVESKNLKDLFVAEEKAVDEAMQNAVEHALQTHKRAGNSIATWKDGQVVIIPAEEIPTVDKTGKRRK